LLAPELCGWRRCLEKAEAGIAQIQTKYLDSFDETYAEIRAKFDSAMSVCLELEEKYEDLIAILHPAPRAKSGG